MQKSLAKICEGFSFSEDVVADALGLLIFHGRSEVAKHVAVVGDMAQRIAGTYSVDQELARLAGFLHDISLIIPTSEMLSIAFELGLDRIPEEEQVPYLIHGKLSAAMAKSVFGVKDDKVIHAITCHSTLCANANPLDKVLFIADKMSWDPEHSPFRPELEETIERSLDEAVGCFLTWTWTQREKLDVIHPWLRAAWDEFKCNGFCMT